MVTPCGSESNGEPGVSKRPGLGRDVAWTYVTPLAAALSSLALLGYALREIGTADYGLFAVLSSVIALVTMLDYSLSTSVVRSTVMHATAATSAARDTAKHEVAIAHSALMALGTGLAALGLPIAYVLPVVINVPPGRESALFICTLLLSLAAGISLATAALPGAARGYRGFRAVALSALVGMSVRVLLVVLLAPGLKLVALGIAQLASVVADRLILLAWTRRRLPWFPLRPRAVTLASARRVTAFAAPLLLFAVDYQLVTSSDAIVIGSLTTASAVAAYRVGAVLPTQALLLLETAWTAIFPRLTVESSSATDRIALMRLATRVLSYVGGVGFSVIALFRRDLVQLVLGYPDSLASMVLLLFSLVFAIHLGVQGLFMLLVASGRHGAVRAVVPIELAINLPLTVVLVKTMGPEGAAVAGAVSYGVKDLVVFPFLARRELPAPAKLIAVDTLVPLALGAAVCAVSTIAVRLVLEPSAVRILVGALVASLFGAVAGFYLLRPVGRKQLLAAVRA